MTVREMIRQLIMYPMDSQVVDTQGSPIMYMRFYSRENDNVRLEPMSQIDKSEWLNDFFDHIDAGSMSDLDVCQELKDQGFTLEDLRNYRQDTYEYAINTGFDW